jgi:uncharacterized repeat protein (TIGR03803 family)
LNLTNKNSIQKILLLTSLLFFSSVVVADSQYRILHHFTGGTQDGATPMAGALVLSGDKLYGTTKSGGSNNLGTVFKIDTDGTNFQILHSFVSAATDGSKPYGTLLLSDSVLYGMASCEGTGYQGTIFKLNIDGSGFQVLHTFSGTEGKWPYDTLIQSGSTLYGMTVYGGNNTGSGWVGHGSIFKINTDGSGFQLLRTFSDGSSDGGRPHGSLIRSGSTLYGTTLWGGSNGTGTIFKINTDGTGFQLLHSFISPAADGRWPYGTLLLYDSTLYGMASSEETGYGGNIFKIDTDGSDFQVIHNFTSDSNDGWYPYGGSLVRSGELLYGMTHGGGKNDLGTIFKIKTNGTDFELLHSFTGDSNDGAYPWGSVILSGQTLYGMTYNGGSSNSGVIFALDLEFADCNEVKQAGLKYDADIFSAGDCYVDLYDFSVLAAQWMNCNNPQDPNCYL